MVKKELFLAFEQVLGLEKHFTIIYETIPNFKISKKEIKKIEELYQTYICNKSKNGLKDFFKPKFVGSNTFEIVLLSVPGFNKEKKANEIGKMLSKQFETIGIPCKIKRITGLIINFNFANEDKFWEQC